MIAARASFSIPLSSGRTLELGRRTLVMGILNITPDSFADGGARLDPDVAIRDGQRMAELGADLLDIGGESTRPGALAIDVNEELRRVVPVIEGLRATVAVPLSIDTYKAEVADRALHLGAEIVNDISGLTYDAELGGVVARHRAALVLMHTRGRSSDMYRHAEYGDVATDVARELEQAIERATASGVPREQTILDPGFGFAKRAEQTLQLFARLDVLAGLGRPLLVGPSRKSFLRLGLGDVPARERLWGTAAAVTAVVLFGAHIVRVHDVEEMMQVVKVADAIRSSAD